MNFPLIFNSILAFEWGAMKAAVRPMSGNNQKTDIDIMHWLF